MGVDLPEDPVNDGALTTSTASTGYTYSYYSGSFGCDGEWYMLTYRLEGDSSPDSPGVTRCDTGTKFNYSGTMTVGVNNVTG